MGVAGAQQSALAGEAAALDARFNASLAEIDGQQQATASQAKALDLRREAIKRVGAARVAFGASGLDISSGQLSAIEGSIASDLEYGLALEKENENLARVGGQLKSLRYQSQAASSIAAGQAKAGGGYIGTGIKMAEGLLSIAKRG